MIPPPPRPTLFPYTTLFRSVQHLVRAGVRAARRHCRPEAGGGGDSRKLAALPEGEGFPGRGVENHPRSEEHTSELQSRQYLVCRLLLEKKKKKEDRQILVRQ